ncbi:interleukin-20-like [Heptranchias perlo]|uniref:interleukin-20-like n=1 Tax=Heptranchias perlo TaxID=212740 RepID=UPI003559D851
MLPLLQMAESAPAQVQVEQSLAAPSRAPKLRGCRPRASQQSGHGPEQPATTSAEAIGDAPHRSARKRKVKVLPDGDMTIIVPLLCVLGWVSHTCHEPRLQKKLLPATMKGFGVFFCLAISVFICQPLAAQTRRLHFGQCSLMVNLQEIREYFSEIRPIIQADDAITDIRLLTESIFHGIQAEESCCFLRHVLRFYVETVFKHHTSSSSLIERRTSSLANSFLSIKRDLRQCNAQLKCNCGEESKVNIARIQNAYESLDLNAAAVKAIGEVDVLIHWMAQSHQI